HVGGRVAAYDARPQAGQATGGGVLGGVRTRHFVAQRQHDFGDAAHAGAADADEVHARERTHQVVGVVEAADHGETPGESGEGRASSRTIPAIWRAASGRARPRAAT